MDSRALQNPATTPVHRTDRDLDELRALLARAERGSTADDRCAARIFRGLIELRSRR